jgi:hypothetical protein
VFPRQLFDEIGLFDASYRVSGDNDLYIRCLLNDYQLICNSIPAVIRRIHDQGQATNWNNLGIRKQCRLKQINKYHHQAARCSQLPPMRFVRAQVHALYASRYYLRQRNFLAWLDSSLRAVYNAPVYGFSCMQQDIDYYIHHYILQNFRSRVKRKIFSWFKFMRNA